MKITQDHGEFIRRAGWISDYERLEELGFKDCPLAGTFHKDEVHQLLEFCAKNPEYHVISYVGKIIVNRYDPNGNVFKLCDGDDDPDYALDMSYFERNGLREVFQKIGMLK